MSGWVRLWHDMPTDPKWRTIARKSGQSVSEVIAVFNFMMVNASANANERGRTHNLFAEDIAAALDVEQGAIEAIFAAMEGKVLADGFLLGWEKRQPKREDNSASRAKQWRQERKRTQTNANERPDIDAESIPLAKAKGSDEVFWAEAKAYLGGNGSGALIGQWCRDFGKRETAQAITAAQLERPADRKSYIIGVLRKGKVSQSGDYGLGINGPC